MIRKFIVLASLAAALPASAATTIQQDFDAAQALLDAGKPAAARDAFTALLGRLPAGSRGKAASLVRARLGSTLMMTGDLQAAAPMLEAAVVGIKGNAPADAADRGAALYDLGRARQALGALDGSAQAYRAASAEGAWAAGSIEDIAVRAGLARALIWSNPDEARSLVDGLLALPPANFGKTADQRALLQTLRGRIELNAGQPAEAKRWFTLAARSAGGGETETVSIADVRIRGDLALANAQLGLQSEVQRNVAFSGAGSLVAEGLTAAVRMPLPACAPVTGLAPDAVAVVEFAIGADGRVSGVTPIYASRGSGARLAGARDDGPEVAFPQAVRRWFWNTAAVTKLNPFWRQAVRVELRCFTARPDQSPVADGFEDERLAFLRSIDVRPMPDLPDNPAAALPLIRAELARREADDGPGSPQLLAPLRGLATNGAAPPADRQAASARQDALLVAAKAPAAVLGGARLTEIAWLAAEAPNRIDYVRRQRDRLLALLGTQEADGDGETRIAMATRLRLAEVHEALRATAAARALLDRIVAAPGSLLPGADPIRIAALLRLSNQAAAADDTATAASAFAATGLSPEQCSLVDVRPLAVNASIGSKAFPNEARRWGTGGFVRIGYDITADGKPTNLRTIVASPPFVFGASTEKAVSQFRYRPVFRPGNSIGCTGTTQGVTFRVAG